MKCVADGLFTAFSLYSALHAPFSRLVGWDRDSMRYVLCFMPFVGVVILMICMLWQHLALTLDLSAGLFAAVAALLPVGASGGVHMAGYIGAADAARGNAAPHEKAVRMNDSQIGTFGALGCAAYLLLTFGLWFQLYGNPRLMLIPLAGYVASRAFGALSVVYFPCALSSDTAYYLAGSASKRAVSAACSVFAGMSFAYFVLVDRFWGGASAIVCVLCYLWHKGWCVRKFGGNTGHLTGYLICKLELVTLFFSAMGVIVGPIY